MATANPALLLRASSSSSSDDEQTPEPEPEPLPPPPVSQLLPPLALSALPEQILADILQRLALPDVILVASCCRAMRDAAQAVCDAVRENAEQHPLPIALALGQFTKPALTRALLSPCSNYTTPQPDAQCQWRDPAWVFVYMGTVLLGTPQLEIWSYASLPRCAVVGRLVHEVLAAAPPQLRGSAGTSGLTTASALSAIATALLGSPMQGDTDFPHCILGLRACLWPLRLQPLEAAAGLEAVRRVCKAWPLAPLEGTREGIRARRRAVEWLNVADTVANLIMRDWPAHTAALAIAAAHTPVMETTSPDPGGGGGGGGGGGVGGRDRAAGLAAGSDSDEDSLSDDDGAGGGGESDSSDGASDGSSSGSSSDAEHYQFGDDGFMHVARGEMRQGRRRRRRGRRQELRRGGSGSDLDPVAATLWTWKWTQAPSAIASVVASSCSPRTYQRPEGWAAEFVGVLLRVLVWPAVSLAVRTHAPKRRPLCDCPLLETRDP